jgi:cellulose synthase/poly-beta-1,6-N-acetylglucosamine synthase-like glycosyltransferase
MMGWAFAAVYFASGAFLFYQTWIHLALLRARPTRNIPSPSHATPDHIVIQLPLFNEPQVVLRLLNAVADMEIPCDITGQPVATTVQILDDSTDSTSELVSDWLAQTRFQAQHIRRSNRNGFKAGALQEGLALCPSHSAIVIFDADFVPPRDFLLQVIPRLMASPQIGAVQTRWDHLNPSDSALTAVQALNLDAHFAVEQEGRQRLGVWNSFNGTAGVWRKEAIDAAGGWQHDTLAEDLDLSIRVQACGWTIEYADDIGAPAELPADMQSYLTQQRRWTQGGAACAAKHLRAVRAQLPSGPMRTHATAQLLASSIHIPVWLMTVSSVPMLVNSTQTSTLPLRLGGIFLLTLTMFFVLYGTAALRRANIRWFPLKMVAMLALGSGTTWHNAKAAWEGWRRKPAEFVRTPKRGELPAVPLMAGWIPKDFASAEWLHALWFGTGFAWGVDSGEWGLAPFHALLMAGYIWVAWTQNAQ